MDDKTSKQRILLRYDGLIEELPLDALPVDAIGQVAFY